MTSFYPALLTELQYLYEYIITCLQAAGLTIAIEKYSDFASISICGFCIGAYCNAFPKNSLFIEKKSKDFL